MRKWRFVLSHFLLPINIFNFIPRWLHEHPVQLEMVSKSFYRYYKEQFLIICFITLNCVGSFMAVERRLRDKRKEIIAIITVLAILTLSGLRLHKMIMSCALHKFLVTSEATGTNNRLIVIILTIQMYSHVTLPSSRETVHAIVNSDVVIVSYIYFFFNNIKTDIFVCCLPDRLSRSYGLRSRLRCRRSQV